MNERDLKGHFTFSLLPAFTVGINDSINPCGIAAGLIFFLYLSLVGYTKKRIFVSGLLLILSAALMNFFLTLGAFDHILTNTGVLSGIRIIYLLLAAVFLILGVLNILDWWRYKKNFDTACFKLDIPVFLKDYKCVPEAWNGKRILKAIKSVLLAVIVGSIIAFMAAVYPQDEYIFIVDSFLMTGGDREFVLLSFMLYSITLVLPLVFVWLIILCVPMKAKENPKIISYYKGISSALFLSAGIGLGYFFLS